MAEEKVAHEQFQPTSSIGLKDSESLEELKAVAYKVDAYWFGGSSAWGMNTNECDDPNVHIFTFVNRVCWNII